MKHMQEIWMNKFSSLNNTHFMLLLFHESTFYPWFMPGRVFHFGFENLKTPFPKL